MRLIAVLLVAAFGASRAVGNDIESKPTAFEGVYVGGSFGVAASDGNTDSPVLSGGTKAAPFNPENGNGFGVFAGYNFQNGPIVYGAEAGYTRFWGLLAKSKSGPEDRDITGVLDVRGRLGYVTGDLMIYGTLGWSRAHIHVHPGAQFGDRNHGAELYGMSYGAGLEYDISDDWSVGADFMHRELSGEFSGATSSTELNLNTATLRLAYRF